MRDDARPRGWTEMKSLDAIAAETRHAYNLAADRYHELFDDELREKPYDREILDRFASSCDRRSLVCDAGCGPSAHIGRYVLEKGAPVVGVDISDRCVELAGRRNRDMRVVQGDIGSLPFRDGSFGGLISYYSLIDTPREYVAGLFDEFRRVLIPGGILLVAVKAGDTEAWATDLLGLDTKIWFTLFQRDEIGRYLEGAGFEVELLHQRGPYGFEIATDRIFAIGRKQGPR